MKVAVVYDVGSAGPLDLAQAARGLCDLIFVHQRGDPRTDGITGLLGEVGTPLDVTGFGTDGIVTALRGLHPAGIVTFSENQLRLTAELAARLGLPGNSRRTVRRLTDKASQRTRLASCGVDSVRFGLIRGLRDVDDALAAVGTPAVIKPRTGTGSRHTYLVRSNAEARRTVADVFDSCRAAGERMTLLLEELLVGDEHWAASGWGDYLSVESVTVAGEIRHLGIAGRFPLAPPFRETGLMHPSPIGEPLAERARALTSSALAALGVEFGVTHTEIKVTAGGPRVIEVNGRLGGYVADVLRRSGAPDPVRAALLASLGRGEGATVPVAHSAVAFQLHLPAPDRVATVAKVHGLEQIGALSGVQSVRWSAPPGTTLDWREGTQSYLGVVSGAAPDHDRLSRLRAQISSLLRIEYADPVKAGR